MSTSHPEKTGITEAPESAQESFAEAAPGTGFPAVVLDEKAKKSWFNRLPIVSHLRQSVGLQRGMLVTGLVICAVILIAAIFAPLIAPYDYAQLRTPEGAFGAQQPPSASVRPSSRSTTTRWCSR